MFLRYLEELTTFLLRCRNALKPSGIVVVKDNVSSDDTATVHTQDSSVSRTKSRLKRIFAQARLHAVKCETQNGFTSSLLPVKIFALIAL